MQERYRWNSNRNQLDNTRYRYAMSGKVCVCVYTKYHEMDKAIILATGPHARKKCSLSAVQ